MNILVTGANGYIGTRLIPSLLEAGHRVWCLVRDPRRMRSYPHHRDSVHILKGDLLDADSLQNWPAQIDVAFYLVHSMSTIDEDFETLEETCAANFVTALGRTEARQVVYLSGICNDRDLSKHLGSRHKVEIALQRGPVPVTTLRAAVIIGSGSASFEILRDLVEKLPFMITPRWVKSRCQPIGIADVIFYLQAVMLHEETLGRTFDIGGPDVMTYREMMLLYAKVRGLRRYMVSVPVLTPRLSSYWLYFITATSFTLARSLVDSLRNEVVCGPDHIEKVIPHRCLGLEQALTRAMAKIESKEVLSSWKDSLVSGTIRTDYLNFVDVPDYGVFKNVQRLELVDHGEETRTRIFSIGGDRGWYHMNWAWQVRGFLDKLAGGVGLRRGRRHPTELRIGDAVDFWRTLVTTAERDRLVLFAEMKMPGEAWLEFRIDRTDDRWFLTQTATFRPRGLLGRLYWYSLCPIHFFVFRGMAEAVAYGRDRKGKTKAKKIPQTHRA
ncbi:MAG: SDR family oxidoreductase [Acidobacteriota bacterium]|nr:SDR family oxidoreductase [Acidobacteriota bacterium]